MLHRRETFSVSSLTLKVLTVNMEEWNTFVDSESTEPHSPRHLLVLSHVSGLLVSQPEL